jgi:hypothetical protein
VKLYLDTCDKWRTWESSLFELSYLLSERQAYDAWSSMNKRKQELRGNLRMRVQTSYRSRKKKHVVMLAAVLVRKNCKPPFFPSLLPIIRLLAPPQLLPPQYPIANLESTSYPCYFAVTDGQKSSLQYVLFRFSDSLRHRRRNQICLPSHTQYVRVELGLPTGSDSRAKHFT